MDKFFFGKEVANIDYINEILVDPLVFNYKNLCEEVKEIANSFNPLLGTLVSSRYTKNQKLYNELISEIIKNQFSFDSLKKMYQKETTHPLNKLITDLIKNKTGYMYDRFSKYLVEGTLRELGLVSDEKEKEAI